MDRNQKEALAMRVSVVTILGNLALTIFKLAAGVLDTPGCHDLRCHPFRLGVMSTFVVIAGVKLSGQESDQEHPFGHERFECVAAILLSVMLAATGAGIGWAGLQKIFGDAGELVVPGQLALIAAVVSIVSKEGMYWYTRAAAKKIESSALMADAWHHRSDALSSIGSFAGVLGARLGMPVLDPVASVVICLFILKAAWDIFQDAISKMIDRACPAEMEARDAYCRSWSRRVFWGSTGSRPGCSATASMWRSTSLPMRIPLWQRRTPLRTGYMTASKRNSPRSSTAWCMSTPLLLSRFRNPACRIS